MSTQPGAGTVDVGTLARLFVLTPRRIQQLAAEGIIPKGSHGSYPLAPAITGYVTWLQKKVSGETDSVDLTTQRARLAKEQADKTAMENAQLRGVLVHADDVIATWTACAGAMRARMLAAPTKVAPLARVATTDAEAAAVIEAEVLEALEELSEDGLPVAARARRERAAGSAEAAASADGEPVGGPVPAAEPGKRRRARSVEN